MLNKLTDCPVVILPGWLLSPKNYVALESELKRYGFNVYTVDFPGFKNRNLSRVLNLTDYVKFLNKFLKQKKLTRVIFIAHSFGGRVALKLLSQNSKLAVALIISGTPGFPETAMWRLKLTQFLVKIGKLLSFLPPFIFFRKKIRQLFYRLNRNQDYLKATGKLKSTFENIIQEQLLDYMNKIRVPTLLLWGEKDRLVSVKTARKMQQFIKNSKMVVLPDLGHMLIYKQAEIATAQIKKFLETIIC